mgnify:CR=1 FL=1
MGTGGQLADENYVLAIQQNAIEDIKSRGFDIENYIIRFTNDT